MQDRTTGIFRQIETHTITYSLIPDTEVNFINR